MNTLLLLRRSPLALAPFLALALALAPNLHAGKPTINDADVRLSSNENPFGFSPKALERMKAALDSGNYYNHNDVGDMVALCAEKEGVPEDYILATPTPAQC